MGATPRRTTAENSAIWAELGKLSKASGLGADELRPTLDALCERASGQRHTSHLDSRQAQQVIRGLKAEVGKYELKVLPKAVPATPPTFGVVEGGRAAKRTDTDGARPALRIERAAPQPRPHAPWAPRSQDVRGRDQPTTAFQYLVIDGLFGLLGMAPDKRLAFTLRQCKGEKVSTQAQADALIEPLKRMALSRNSVQVALTRTRDALAVPQAQWKVSSSAGYRWKVEFLTEIEARFAAANPAGPLKDVDRMSFRVLEKWLECIHASGLLGGL